VGLGDPPLSSSVVVDGREGLGQVSGFEYNSDRMRLTKEQFKALPVFTFVFDNGVEMTMDSSAYIECEGNVSAPPSHALIDYHVL
jgi:hypothetical protein